MAKPEARKKARELRTQGKSIKAIASEVDVSTSTVSRWVRDIKLSESQLEHLSEQKKQWGSQNKGAQNNKAKAKQQRLQYQQEGRKQAQKRDWLHMQGCMLYWAEGAKERNRLEFVNSDVHMMKLFMKFMRNSLNINDADIVVRIHCHDTEVNRIHEIENYWSKTLNIPLENFGKTQIKQGTSSRKNRLTNGICTLRVDNTKLVHHVFGAIQEYGDFDNPDWIF